MIKNYNVIIKKLKQAKSVAVFTHISPDADGLGSLSALCLYGAQSGKDICGYIDEVPAYCKFIVPENVATCLPSKEYDLYFVVDTPNKSKLGKFRQFLENKENVVSIDHHRIRDEICKNEYVDPETSSASEIMYGFFKELGAELDIKMATVLYAGIAADTGCFLHNNTTCDTHIIAGELLKKGVDLQYVNTKMFKSISLATLELHKVVVNSARTIENAIFARVPLEMQKDLGLDNVDSMQFQTLLSSIEGIDFSFVLSEKENGIYKINLRSKNQADVSVIAKVFGGGGHTQASGCTITGNSFEDVEEKIMAEVRKQNAKRN